MGTMWELKDFGYRLYAQGRYSDCARYCRLEAVPIETLADGTLDVHGPWRMTKETFGPYVTHYQYHGVIRTGKRDDLRVAMQLVAGYQDWQRL